MHQHLFPTKSAHAHTNIVFYTQNVHAYMDASACCFIRKMHMRDLHNALEIEDYCCSHTSRFCIDPSRISTEHTVVT
eukprot:m.1073575 g.1073575  ORF g.1073575 m.1073575 type:complete len:77 (+) comp24235_c0_seq4:549-779(+)